MVSPIRLVLAVVCASWLVIASASAQTFTVTSDHADGVYAVGDTARWTVTWTGTSAPPAARFVARRGGYTELARGDLSFTDKKATLETAFDRPDSVLIEVNWGPTSSPNRVYGGAVASPEGITPAADEPADFDAFWNERLAELAAVPMNPQLESVDSGRAGVSYWKLTMDNVRGLHIQAQLARPTTGTTFPAILIPQWAGVYPLHKSWVTQRAAEGWLALNLNAHDLPIDQPDSYYQQQANGALSNYWAIGNDDPNTSYYLRMYLACYRAVEYLKTRSDWDGRTLVVTGASQGGQQTFATLGLQRDVVTAGVVIVPAAADTLARDAGRAPGFPNWLDFAWGKDLAKVRAASRYYDPVNFARRAKAPILIGAGLYDQAAPPASVLAAANVMTAPREVILLQSGHDDVQGSMTPYNNRASQWFTALRTGQPAPVVEFPARPAQVPVAGGTGSTQIVNLSSRGIVRPGGEALIAGFYVNGTAPKKLLIVASGLNLRRFGLTGEIGRPRLSLYRSGANGNELMLENSDWQENAAAITSLGSSLGAQPLSASSDPAHGDAAVIVTLPPGGYSVVVAPDARSATTDGIGLVELYDAEPDNGSRLINLSTRGRIEGGARQMIVGVSTRGSGTARLLLRAVGPGMAPFGVGGYLTNPSQVLYRNDAGQQTIVATNEDWWNSAQADQAAALTQPTGAFGLPRYSADAALVQRLQAGTYSVIIVPREGTTGVGLAEIYEAN